MTKVAVLDDYQEVALQMADWKSLPSEAEVIVFKNHLSDENDISKRLEQFEVVSAMRERTPFPKRLLEKLPNLKLLVTTGMRNASIDIPAASKLGITVCGTEGLGYPTAELTWGLIVSLARKISEENSSSRSGSWQTTLGIGLNGKTLGILGLGNLGSQVARIGNAFGMNVIAWSQNLTEERAIENGVTLVTFDDLMKNPDFLSIHTVLSERTRGLIGEKELNFMKPTAFLINTSRGPIVDEEALVQALREGVIAGAGLDVFDTEPLPCQHPFLTLPNTLITPHMGYVTVEGYKIFYSQTVECINQYLNGTPVRVLNP
ncbi:MAG: D-2-hydroxyacid dehydrogenase family protein [Chloroflexota bacterium]|jgi:phosphoglycerate dehydrogenase-like enzyme|uniref:D-isomer specific 2-hydroxyacid dehydrogenase NAD-binding domain-containing protein n=1 Tax=marine metagenome TaxID=408172 RepID=A0A381ZIV4_9ZZZZ|nr:D-2-hydroxyacid dehydrogenase family protein [Chloroflexota bacterium]MEC9321125.1 D-2-hydroxyacid dehydrogenase family protein [Chloroflexota bacterium]|tara:strand:- start:212 stop:1165 length:954 start_codon:yes stop_codon:yes gene_type:complete